MDIGEIILTYIHVAGDISSIVTMIGGLCLITALREK